MADENKQQAEAAPEAAASQEKTAPATFRVVLGEKIGMTQVYTPNGELRGVTAVKVGPCPILDVKTKAGKDGYDAVVLGYGERRVKNVSKPRAGQFKASGAKAARLIREFRVSDSKGFEAGQIVSISGRFSAGDYVDVQGTSKGKGFAGAMKRHHFAGLPASHGASDKERSPGSLTARRSLGRVMPGKKMAGHLGAETVTIQKVEIVEVHAETNTLYLGGSVPGPRGGFVAVSETVKMLKKRKEAPKAKGPKKDKMGNIIQTPAPKKGKK